MANRGFEETPAVYGAGGSVNPRALVGQFRRFGEAAQREFRGVPI